MIERGGRFGEGLRAQTYPMFRWWHRGHDGPWDARSVARSMHPDVSRRKGSFETHTSEGSGVWKR
jgi:hypothetical protein